MSQAQLIAQETLPLPPGALWTRVVEQTERALRCGALQPIPVDRECIEQAGICFLIQRVANLTRKDEAKKKQDKAKKVGKEFNPFLPYDPDLFVADLSETHVCLLNKFNVVMHHLLMVTRAFEEQETLLTLQDFEAMWVCLAEIEGLVFYNSGHCAGASQRHKHLQLLPLTAAEIPIAPAVATARFEGAIGTIPAFPFQHALVRFDTELRKPLAAMAKLTLECYHQLLNALNLQDGTPTDRPSGPYNLLATREWMLLVPRSQERFESISVNAVGFAGALLVRNPEQLEILKQQGPLTALQQVAIARSPIG